MSATPRNAKPSRALIAAIIAAVLLPILLLLLAGWAALSGSSGGSGGIRLPGSEKLLEQAESRYQNVYVTETDTVRTLRAGSLRANSSAMYQADPLDHVYEYTRLMCLALGYVDTPRRVLVVGLGGGTLPRYLRAYYPELEIVNVEFDPEVVRLARQWFDFKDDPAMTVVTEDARRFLTRPDSTPEPGWDIVFLDAFHGDYIPFHLMTREFLELVRSRLAPGGVVAANTWQGSRLAEREAATYHAVFRDVHAYDGRRSTNRVIIAANHPLPDQAELEQRMAAVQAERKFMEIDLPGMLTQWENLPANDAEPLIDDHAPVNHLKDQAL